MMLALVLSLNVRAQALRVIALDSGKNTSVRGLSVVNEQTIWASGSEGWVAKSTDGEHFSWRQLKGYETTDFRDIEAFSAKEAILVSSGSPAYILKTSDGGDSWIKVYENRDEAIFLDGMDFWNKREGMIFGDPINGLMQLLITKDRGETWQNIAAKAHIQLREGEAGFAASGTGIRTFKNKVFIATGGSVSRLWFSGDKGKTWKNKDIPIVHGAASTGTFSIAVSGKEVFAVGGDYRKPALAVNNYAFMKAGSGWEKSTHPPNGYRSGIEIASKDILISTGTNGTDCSLDGGENWQILSSEGFNVCRKAKKGGSFFLAGSKGRIAKIKK